MWARWMKSMLPGAALLALMAAPTAYLASHEMALAALGNPTPKPAATPCKKYKKGTRKWKTCMKKQKRQDTTNLKPGDSLASDLNAGYWLIKNGDYEGALEKLRPHENAGNAKVLTYIGFATRKLGDIERGIGYYHRALALDPDLNIAREYLGEGYLQKGDLKAAKRELEEIAKRCGTACEAYRDLAEAIAKYESGQEL